MKPSVKPAQDAVEYAIFSDCIEEKGIIAISKLEIPHNQRPKAYPFDSGDYHMLC